MRKLIYRGFFREFMRIRLATKKDIKEIGRLMLSEFTKPPFNEKALLPAVIKSLQYYFKIGKIFVAVKEKEIVGVLVFKTEQWWEGPVIIIEDLAIKHEHKRKGIGKALMEKIEKYVKKNKIKKITFKTHKKSEALKFYKKIGYKIPKNIIEMEKHHRNGKENQIRVFFYKL